MCGARVTVSQREAVHTNGGIHPRHQRWGRAAQQKRSPHDAVGHHCLGCCAVQRGKQARCCCTPGQAAAKRGVQQAQLLG